jgi:DNA invertase Pin-like site-specific DNA recombinase
VEEKIRAQYGGLRVRIPKRKKHATSEARDQVYSDGLTTMTTGEITQKHGISRATLYRVMKNRAG